jgi:hypothetical protein
MAVTDEILALVLEKARIPHFTKVGLVLSYVMFKGLDIEGLVKRAMQAKEHHA